MKIGDLQEHCFDCPLFKYCTDEREILHLCSVELLKDVEVETYRDLASNVTGSEIWKIWCWYKPSLIHDKFMSFLLRAINDIVMDKLPQNQK